MSRDVVRPMSPTGNVDFHSPTGRCSTKPWSNWTGPPKNTDWRESSAAASGISTWWKSASSVTSMGRFTTIPRAPRSLCSHTKVRVREKFGSCIAGMAMRKWLVRLMVCMGHRSGILILRRIWLKTTPGGSSLERTYRASLFWFRRDLRLEDNAGLYYALRTSERVHCAFVFDREILDALPSRRDRRLDFIHRSL